MVVDRLENLPLYSALRPGLEDAAAFLRRFDPATADGRIDLDGDRLYALVQSFTTEPPGRRRFEAHRRYLDVQCVLAGAERIDVQPRMSLSPTSEYDPSADIIFFDSLNGASSQLVLKAGDFALFLPGEAHKPCCMTDRPSAVRKVVIKLRVDRPSP